MNIPLKTAIMEKFSTQADFAQQVGACESFVSRIVRGRRELSEEKQKEWAKHLGVSVNQIFS